MKKITMTIGLGILLLSQSFNNIHQVQAQTITVTRNDKTEQMSHLRLGFIQALDTIQEKYPDIIFTSCDIHRHRQTDKYIYRISGSSATYEYQWIFYDNQVTTSSRPLPTYFQSIIFDLLSRNENYLENKMNLDKITNVVKNHYQDSIIRSWHFSDLRYELPHNNIYPERTGKRGGNHTPLPHPGNPVFWFVELENGVQLERVLVDGITGDILDYPRDRIYDVDILTYRKNYYQEYYEAEKTIEQNKDTNETLWDDTIQSSESTLDITETENSLEDSTSTTLFESTQENVEVTTIEENSTRKNGKVDLFENENSQLEIKQLESESEE